MNANQKDKAAELIKSETGSTQLSARNQRRGDSELMIINEIAQKYTEK